MRLIDADALLEAHQDLIAFGTDTSFAVRNLITNAPTVQREGWKLVPIEPTPEMLNAFNEINKWLESTEGTAYKVQASYYGAIGEPYYKAMISAVPDTEK